MIDKYPELAQYVTTGEHGQMSLSEKGQQEAIKFAQQNLATAQVQKMLAQQKYVTAQNNQTALNAARAEFQDIVRQNTSTEVRGGGESTYTEVNTNNQAIANNIKQLASEYKEAVKSGNKELVDQFIATNNLTPQQITALENVNNALDKNTAALNTAKDATAAAILSSEEEYAEADEVGKQVMRNKLKEKEEALQSEMDEG